MAMEIGPWRRGVPPDRQAEVGALLRRVRAADRRGPDGPPEGDIAVLPAVVDGQWAGLVWRSGADPAELYVDPAHRGRGYGTALAGAALAGAALGSGGIWAHGTLPAAEAVAARLGAVPVRRLLQLRRPSSGPLPVVVPDGVVIRTLVVGGDEDAVLAVNARAFAWHPEQGRLDRAALDAEMAQPRFDADGFFLAVDAAGTLLGFHWTVVHAADPTPPPGGDLAHADPIGEVYVLGVDPRSPIRGLGAPLTAAGLNYLAARGMRAVLLYVESDNEPALRLYRRFGFADYATDTVFATAR